MCCAAELNSGHRNWSGRQDLNLVLNPIGSVLDPNARPQSGEKRIVPDPERFPLVKRLWELFLSGTYTVPQLRKIAADELGLRMVMRKKVGILRHEICGCTFKVAFW